ncbi:hypothetical protein Tco_1516576 [Tanacetum coccineum]
MKSWIKAYDRFPKLISLIVWFIAAHIIKEDINQKFLRSLPPSWSQIALIIRNKPDIDQTDINDLYNNLRVYEDEMKRSSSSTSNSQNWRFFFSENTSSTMKLVLACGNLRVKSLLEELVQQVKVHLLQVRSSDEESTLANDMFSKADGYHVVPPYITGNFLTPRADISFAGSGYHQKDRKPSQNDNTEHGMEKTVQNQGQSPKSQEVRVNTEDIDLDAILTHLMGRESPIV